MRVIGWTCPSRKEYLELDEFGEEEAQTIIDCLRDGEYIISGEKHVAEYEECTPVLSNLRMVRLSKRTWAKLQAAALEEKNFEMFEDDSYQEEYRENEPYAGHEPPLWRGLPFYIRENEFYGDDMPNFAIVPYLNQPFVPTDMIILPRLEAVTIEKIYSIFGQEEWDSFLLSHNQYQSQVEGRKLPPFPFVLLELGSYPACFFASIGAEMIQYAKSRGANVLVSRQDWEHLEFKAIFEYEDDGYRDVETEFDFRYDHEDGEVAHSRCFAYIEVGDVGLKEVYEAVNRFNSDTTILKAFVIHDDDTNEYKVVIRYDFNDLGNIMNTQKQFEQAVNLFRDSFNAYALNKLASRVSGEEED